MENIDKSSSPEANSSRSHSSEQSENSQPGEAPSTTLKNNNAQDDKQLIKQAAKPTATDNAKHHIDEVLS
jgi:hypothetical protein